MSTSASLQEASDITSLALTSRRESSCKGLWQIMSPPLVWYKSILSPCRCAKHLRLHLLDSSLAHPSRRCRRSPAGWGAELCSASACLSGMWSRLCTHMWYHQGQVVQISFVLRHASCAACKASTSSLQAYAYELGDVQSAGESCMKAASCGAWQRHRSLVPTRHDHKATHSLQVKLLLTS